MATTKASVNYIITGHGSVISREKKVLTENCSLFFYSKLDEILSCNIYTISKNICNRENYIPFEIVNKNGTYNEMQFSQHKNKLMRLGIRKCPIKIPEVSIFQLHEELPGEILLIHNNSNKKITLSEAIKIIKKRHAADGRSRTHDIHIHILSCRGFSRKIRDSDKIIKSRLKLGKSLLAKENSKEELEKIYETCRRYLIKIKDFKKYWKFITDSSPLLEPDEYDCQKKRDNKDPRYVLTSASYNDFYRQKDNNKIMINLTLEEAKIINESYKTILTSTEKCDSDLNTLSSKPLSSEESSDESSDESLEDGTEESKLKYLKYKIKYINLKKQLQMLNNNKN